MTDQQLLDATLSFFDVQRDITADSNCKEVSLFNTYRRLGIIQACRLAKWTFLMKSRQYYENECLKETDADGAVQYYSDKECTRKLYLSGASYYTDSACTVEYVSAVKYAKNMSYKGFGYGFVLPSSASWQFIRPVYINGKYDIGFAIMGNMIFCNLPDPRIDFISTDTTYAPDDFWFVVAYRIAMEICRFLDPNGKALDNIKTNLTLTLQTLLDCDNDNSRRQNPDPAVFVP